MRNYLLFVSFLLTVSILNAQPSPVSIVLPQDGSTAIISPKKIIWNKSPLALTYTIEISTDKYFSSTASNQAIILTGYTSDTTYSTLLWSPSVLETSTKYYLRVKAENTNGASSWTNAMFTTKLNIPSLILPLSGAIDLDVRPTLIWGNVLSSAKYTVQLSRQSNFETITRSIDTTATIVTLDSLSHSTTYYWRVRAYLNGDTTEYSDQRYFTTIQSAPMMSHVPLKFPGEA